MGLTPTYDPAEYDVRRKRVKEMFVRLQRGSQARASYALETSASTISNVLSGRYIDEGVLAKLDRWASDQLAAPVA